MSPFQKHSWKNASLGCGGRAVAVGSAELRCLCAADPSGRHE